MDLWATLGISPVAGMWAAAVGVVVALALAAVAFTRRSRESSQTGLGLDSHRRG
jgi:hypothetical protein